MDLYEAVYNRKSVRRYKMELLPQEFFRNLRKFEQGLQPFVPELHYSVEFINAMDKEARVRGLFHVKAPYYMVFFSEPGKYAMVNAGYLLEQIVLYMTGHGVGTCYQGSAKAVGLSGPAGMEPVMVVAFGYADERLHRESFRAKRLPLKDLCVFKEDSTEETRLMLQAARLAPSALNRQPWRFIVYQNRIHIFSKKEPVSLRTKESRIGFDMGIMLFHVTLAAEECWRDIEFARKENLAAREMRSSYYFMSVLLV
ncbi:MAG: nitroreductase [Lachnospiraceae bacterium]|jgi:nitroreductase|nr:nitroreductase [Lachnospiraceae bacterium]